MSVRSIQELDPVMRSSVAMIERYSRAGMARVWSEENRLRLMLKVELAFLKALAAEKGIPASELKALEALLERSLLEQAKGKELKPRTMIAVSLPIMDGGQILNRDDLFPQSDGPFMDDLDDLVLADRQHLDN